MNELLSPILLAVSRDSEDAVQDDSQEGAALLKHLVDKGKVEHDSYTIFDRLMGHMKRYFVVAKPNHGKSRRRSAMPTETPIVARCEAFQEGLLKRTDRQLYRHLVDNDVQPTLYLLRWIRLLFAREFHIDDVMTIWDHLFATSKLSTAADAGGTCGIEIPLVDFMCLAMCLFVRSDLMQGDNSICLRRLLRYPPVGDMGSLISRAVTMMNGKRWEKEQVNHAPPSTGNDERKTMIKGLMKHTSRTNPIRATGGLRNKDSPGSSGGASILSGLFGKLSADETKQNQVLQNRVIQLEKQLTQMNKMGDIISSIVDTLQAQLTNGGNPNMSVILRSLAELKSVKDVLIGRIQAESVLAYLGPKNTQASPSLTDPLGQTAASQISKVEVKGGGSPAVKDAEQQNIENEQSSTPSPSGEKVTTLDETVKNVVDPEETLADNKEVRTGGGASLPDDDDELDIEVLDQVRTAMKEMDEETPHAQSPTPVAVEQFEDFPERKEKQKPPSKAELMKKHEALLDDLLGNDEEDMSRKFDVDDDDGEGFAFGD